MSTVSRARDFGGSADEMWSRIGDFHGAEGWHPAVVSSDALADGDVRQLNLGDGGKILETQTGKGPRSYSYRIDEGPLPVRDYSATLAVSERDGGCTVTWEAEFEPDGASEAEACAAIEGMFDAGLDNL